MLHVLLISCLLLVGICCGLTLLWLRAEKQCRELDRVLGQAIGRGAGHPDESAISRLAGAIAHDLNNLLIVITGNAELLAEAAAEPEQQRDATTIVDASTQAAELTRRLLAFSRPGQQITLPVNLNVILGSLNRLLKDVAGERISLEIIPAPELPTINADPDHLESLLIELVSYCRTQTTTNGRILIRTMPFDVHPEGALFDEHGVAVGDYVGVFVTVEGAAIVDATGLFEPEARDGSSALARSAVALGGRIFADSANGNAGLGINLLFPARPEDAEPAKHAILRGSGTILLAEDSDQLRHYVQRALSSLGYDVFSARGSEEAVFLFRRHAESIDLLVADVMMPIETGTQLYDRLKAMNPKLPALFISGYSFDSLEDENLLSSDAPLLTRPFTVEQLAQHVGQQISKR